ncbi:multidrug efflux protein, outer membrane component [Legionella busanensis]|uniref:Multidrug efflux protein, outer membrane component n=1 Tax=Legionella busanensis TaxID=190655 RepID=A0A378K9K5_9GAMM|nr:TolC family protein [Legionella busanensis]STX81199.1 multidrug efflux protein, outer membrane component [Legionella busanensis]
MRLASPDVSKTMTSSLFLLLTSLACFAKDNLRPLSIDTVLASVNHCYPQITIARLEVAKTQGHLISALGQFDPTLNINSRSQPFGGYVNGYINNEVIVPTLFNGLKLVGGYRIGRGDWPIYYQNYLTNSGGEYRAGVSLPLLKDRLIDKERTKLLTQAQRVALTAETIAVKKIKIYREAIEAYWQWVQAGLQVQALKSLLRLAKDRQTAIVKQAHQGDLALLAIAENGQLILQRQQLLNQSERLLRQAAISLSLYYRDNHGHPKLPLKQQLPKDLTPLSEETIKPEEFMQEQLRCHPALRQLKRYYHIVKFKQTLAKNDLLPELDATFYTSKQYGSGGYPRLLPQAGLVGIRFRFPLYQREAKGRLISATSELQQIVVEKKFIYEQLTNQLQNFFVALKFYYQQVQLLHQELQLAKQVQSGEVKKFYAGDSTLFLMNQREQMTAQLELNLIAAQVNLQQTKDFIRFFTSTKIK